MSSPVSYHPLAKSLHWLMALLLSGVLALGFYMQGLPFSPAKLEWYSWHKWLGITIFLLALVRVAQRLMLPVPALPEGMSALMRFAAHAGHLTLYLLMLAIPVSGWLMSSAKGMPTVWFGVLPLPDVLARDRALGNTLAEVHLWLNWALIVMVVSHVLAALKHHFMDRDGVLARMLAMRSRDPASRRSS